MAVSPDLGLCMGVQPGGYAHRTQGGHIQALESGCISDLVVPGLLDSLKTCGVGTDADSAAEVAHDDVGRCCRTFNFADPGVKGFPEKPAPGALARTTLDIRW